MSKDKKPEEAPELSIVPEQELPEPRTLEDVEAMADEAAGEATEEAPEPSFDDMNGPGLRVKYNADRTGLLRHADEDFGPFLLVLFHDGGAKHEFIPSPDLSPAQMQIVENEACLTRNMIVLTMTHNRWLAEEAERTGKKIIVAGSMKKGPRPTKGRRGRRRR